MSGDQLRHVTPGEPFRPSAAAWNRFVDVARAVDQGRVIFRPGTIVPVVADGSAQVIMFRPTGGPAPGLGFSCDAVEAVVLVPHCNSGVQIGDIVTVWDIGPRFDASASMTGPGFFRLPQDILFRSTGFATLMKTHETGYDRPEGVGDCRWVVTSMRCAEPTEYY